MDARPDSPGASDRRVYRDLIRKVASDRSNQNSFITDGTQSCRYPDLPAEIKRIASHLRRQGLRPDDTVTLAVGNCLQGALTVLALLDCGQSFMMLPPAGQGSRGKGWEAKFPRFSRIVISVDTAKLARPIAETSPGDYLCIERNPAFESAPWRPPAEEPRLFFKTSGSTGDAKLARFGYRTFLENSLIALELRRFDPSHRITLPIPIFHGFGLGAGFLAGLAGGASFDLQDRSNLLRFLEREAAFEPNIAYVTPSFCEMLIRGRRRPRPYALMITGGDRISETTFRRCEELHGPLVNQYGATELGIVAAGSPDMPIDKRACSVGSVVPGVRHRIVPMPDYPDQAVGELQIQHELGFEGYVNLAGEDLVPPKAFDDAWYRTGDLAAVDADGALTILGRCDLSVNRQGMLLPLAEVESRMREIDGVEEVAVAPGRANLRGCALIAYCVVSRQSGTSAERIRSGFAAMSPAYSVPEIVRIMPELPKLAGGKVDRQLLARLAAEEQAA